jgi:hypothetical protein
MIADTTPTMDGTRSAGNSSRMMPNDSGKTAPPTPWTTRAAISTPTFGASAASRQPTARAISPSSSVRSLPYISPIRPSSGVATETDRSSAVNTQVTVLGVVCRSC